jgi:hypothetical protein
LEEKEVKRKLSETSAIKNEKEEDESNLISKEDFEEGKTKEIVTSRVTPMKHNSLVRKNELSRSRCA